MAGAGDDLPDLLDRAAPGLASEDRAAVLTAAAAARQDAERLRDWLSRERAS